MKTVRLTVCLCAGMLSGAFVLIAADTPSVASSTEASVLDRLAALERKFDELAAENLALRFETYDSNTATINTTSNTWTIGATYRIRGEDLKFSLNSLMGDPATPAEDDSRLIGRMQVMF